MTDQPKQLAEDDSLLERLIQAVIGLLAPFIDKFKAGNPAIFVIVQSVLLTAQYVFTNAVDWGLIPPDTSWLSLTLQIITWLLTALVGSRTARYLKNKDNVE